MAIAFLFVGFEVYMIEQEVALSNVGTRGQLNTKDPVFPWELYTMPHYTHSLPHLSSASFSFASSAALLIMLVAVLKSCRANCK